MTRNKQKGFTIVELLYLVLILLAGYGWIHNIVMIVHGTSDPTVTKMFILRCVGIFVFPLGCILGYF